MMHVVGEWSHVVEKLRIHRPALVFVPQAIADQRAFQFIHGILEQELMGDTALFKHDGTQPFVLTGEGTVFSGRCG